MMNTQTASSAVQRQSSFVPQALKLASDERWSELSEVLNLLQFDGRLQELDGSTLFRRRRVKTGQTALFVGQPYDGLYVVRLGALKISMMQVDGAEHVVAFPMKGDLVGSDGTYQGKYMSEAIALTDCDLIRIPVDTPFSPTGACRDLERVAFWAMSREIVREQTVGVLTYSPKSEVRVARFLSIQSERFASLGYSPHEFILPMTRRDIGNYLNVTLETVSRALSSLMHEGIISVDRREIKIHSQDGLRNFWS